MSRSKKGPLRKPFGQTEKHVKKLKYVSGVSETLKSRTKLARPCSMLTLKASAHQTQAKPLQFETIDYNYLHTYIRFIPEGVAEAS
jgi:hypothetical protein